MRKRIGDIFVEKKLLTPAQLTEALEYARADRLRLGDAAVKLGFIQPEALVEIFGPSNKFDFFYLDANHFPAVTQSLLDPAAIVEFGALPLGFKTEQRLFRTKRLLNIGLLSPERADKIVPELDRLARKKGGAEAFQDIKIYLILAEQLVEVLAKKYAFPEASLKAFEGDMDERLILYLESGSQIVATLSL